MSVHISLIQNAPSLSREKNIATIKAKIEEHPQSDLIIFPELCLNGYQLMDAVRSEAFTRDELQELFSPYKRNFILSCALREDNRFFNTAIYFHQGEIKHIHKKNHLPNYTMFEEARFFAKGEEIAPF